MTTYQLNTSGDLQLNMNALKLSAPLGLAYGGLGADASVSGNLGTIQGNLGLAIGTNVQAHNANLDEFGALTKGSSGQVLAISAGGAYEYATANTYTASSGLSLSAGAFSAVVDGSTVDVNGSNQIEIKAAGVGASQLASGAVDGVTLQGGAGTALSIKALPNNSVTASAIATSAVSTGLSGGGGSALTVDNTVVALLSGNQTVAGIKTFTSQPIFQANFSQQNSSDVGYCRQIEAAEFKSAGSGTAQNAVSILSDSNSVMVAEGYFVCVDSTLAHAAQWDFSIVFTNISGTVTIQQANISSVYKSDTALALAASVSSTDVVLQLTDLSSSPMRCDCNYRVISCPAYA